VLLALGPLQLDATDRTVVVGVATRSGTVEHAAGGADAVWLCAGATAGRVDQLRRGTGLPIGVTVEDLDGLDELVAAGAVALESGSPGAVASAIRRGLALWCDPAQAAQARQAGVPEELVICEGAPGPGVPAATLAGTGPGTWGAAARAVHDGARVVRTADVRSVRRVVTVADRLRRARLASTHEATT
jgi:hypothetical protein